MPDSKIHVRGLRGQSYLVEAETFEQLLPLVQQAEGASPGTELCLYSSGRPLVEGEDLAAVAVVYVSAKLKGGKTHGCINHAGRVRQNTPKVEKEEKKKKPTGRAKKRNQYNRRFMSTVELGPGGKPRTPNCNRW